MSYSRVGLVIGLIIATINILVGLFLHTVMKGQMEIIEYISNFILIPIGWFMGMQFEKTSYLNQQLKQNKEEIQRIFDNVNAMIWKWDFESNKITVSKGFEKIYGYTNEEFAENQFLWQEAVHPDDKEIVEKSVKLTDSGIAYNPIFRIINKKGEIKWIEQQINPIIDADGKFNSLYGVIIDITDRKRAEEEVQHMAFHDYL